MPHLVQISSSCSRLSCSARRAASGQLSITPLPYITARLLRMVLRLWRKHWAANLRKASGSGMAGGQGENPTTAESTFGGGRKAEGGTSHSSLAVADPKRALE